MQRAKSQRINAPVNMSTFALATCDGLLNWRVHVLSMAHRSHRLVTIDALEGLCCFGLEVAELSFNL